MCLSAAYEVGAEGEKLLADKLTGVSVEDDKVRLTNLFGAQILVEGRLKSIDLEKNVILIEAKQ